MEFQPWRRWLLVNCRSQERNIGIDREESSAVGSEHATTSDYLVATFVADSIVGGGPTTAQRAPLL